MLVCFFDIDGTLLASGGAGKAAMEAALKSGFGATPSSNGTPFSGRTDRAIARDLFALHGIEDTPVNWQRFLAAYLGHLPDSLDRHQGRVLPGIASFLDNLRTRTEVAVGLLTGNVKAGARLKLGHYGLWNHFAFGGFGDHHLDRNDVARDAVAALGRHHSGPIDREQIWVVGDTPLDIRCARSIGAQVVAVATGWHSLELLAAERPDLLLPDLSDPQPIWSRWGW